MKDKVLESLIKNGSIKSYEYKSLDNEENMRCTEKLIITFTDNNRLVIDTFCSGTLENTSLAFSK